MSLKWPAKDPDEVLDYAVEWSARIPGDVIATSTWVVPVGLTMNSNIFGTTKTTIWLASGVLAVTYELLNRITTTGGRTMDQTIQIKIKSK